MVISINTYISDPSGIVLEICGQALSIAVSACWEKDDVSDGDIERAIQQHQQDDMSLDVLGLAL